MTTPVWTTAVVDSIEDLRACSDEWNDLWCRAEVARPTLRAEHLLLWLERFAKDRRIQIVLVFQEGRLVFGLPLVSAPKTLGLVGGLPNNLIALVGDLLLDEQQDAQAACKRGALVCRSLRWKMLELNGVELASSRWRLLGEAFEVIECETAEEQLSEVGVIEFPDSFEMYQSTWSKNHARHMKRSLRALDVRDNPRVEFITAGIDATMVREAFEIEHRGWKGPNGTSILSKDSTWEYYKAESRELAERSQLALAFLEIRGERVAFEYLYQAKGRIFVPKVGYDAAWHSVSPGQLLRRLLYEQWYDNGTIPFVDYLGPLVRATDRWSTSSYPVGRLSVSCSNVPARLIRPTIAQLRTIKHQGKTGAAALRSRIEVRRSALGQSHQ